MAAERTFAAMGTTAHVIVNGGDEAALVDQAQARIDDLEAKWSRFRPTSELSRLNDAKGWPCVVSPETFDVVTRAVDAWFLTAGRYDPTILPALVAAGYDRTFDELSHSRQATTRLPLKPPGCAEVRLLADSTIVLPPGVQLDLGGIGKGYAADLVTAELRANNAEGAMVSIGGDLRCTGEAPWPEGWLIDIEHPFHSDRAACTVALADGAVVTTTRLKRSWGRANQQHHIIDPATGRPARTGVASATVIAAEAWWAEVLAKAGFLAGPVEGARLLRGHGATGLLFDDRGRVHPVDVEAFAV